MKATTRQTPRWLLFGFVFTLILHTAFSSGSVKALSFADPPPSPILYGGHVYINDEPVEAGTKLSARVGDYLITVLVESDGLYRNLLVQPPKSNYYGKNVTFHVFDLVAVESDVFTQSGSPILKTTFDIHFLENKTQVIQAEPSATPDSGVPLKEIEEVVVKDQNVKPRTYLTWIFIAAFLFVLGLVSSCIFFINRRRLK